MRAGAERQGATSGTGAGPTTSTRTGSTQAGPSGAGGRSDAPPERVPIDSILRGRQEVIIQHRNDEYRLRITSNGKLLLTK